MMYPILVADTHYGDKFDEIVAWYMLNGYVYSSPEVFIMACEHSKEALMANREINNLDKLNSWYIQYIAGDISRVFDICPHPKEWIVFERWGKGKRKAVKFDRIQQRICYGRTR